MHCRADPCCSLQPFTNDVSLICGLFWPLSLCQHFGPIYSTKIMQPTLLCQDLDNLPPSPYLLTSFVNGPFALSSHTRSTTHRASQVLINNWSWVANGKALYLHFQKPPLPPLNHRPVRLTCPLRGRTDRVFWPVGVRLNLKSLPGTGRDNICPCRMTWIRL